MQILLYIFLCLVALQYIVHIVNIIVLNQQKKIPWGLKPNLANLKYALKCTYNFFLTYSISYLANNRSSLGNLLSMFHNLYQVPHKSNIHCMKYTNFKMNANKIVYVLLTSAVLKFRRYYGGVVQLYNLYYTQLTIISAKEKAKRKFIQQ